MFTKEAQLRRLLRRDTAEMSNLPECNKTQRWPTSSFRVSHRVRRKLMFSSSKRFGWIYQLDSPFQRQLQKQTINNQKFAPILAKRQDKIPKVQLSRNHKKPAKFCRTLAPLRINTVITFYILVNC